MYNKLLLIIKGGVAMSLQSFGFFGFLLVVAAVYLHLPQRWQSAFLLAASWFLRAGHAVDAGRDDRDCGVHLPVRARHGGPQQRPQDRSLRGGVIGLLAILAF